MAENYKITNGVLEYQIPAGGAIHVHPFDLVDKLAAIDKNREGDQSHGYLDDVRALIQTEFKVEVSREEADLFCRVVVAAYGHLKKKHTDIAASLFTSGE